MFEENIPAEDIVIYNDDCFNVLPGIEENSIDLIFSYLPCTHENGSVRFLIDIDPLWEEFRRVLKPDGVAALEAFTKNDMREVLIASNPEMFRGVSFYSITSLAVRHLVVFSHSKVNTNGFLGEYRVPGHIYHSGQTPLGAAKSIISRYTERGDTVLDPCMGTGTTGVACRELGREFIGVEISEKIFDKALKRISGTINE